jgi:hypothetical protein
MIAAKLFLWGLGWKMFSYPDVDRAQRVSLLAGLSGALMALVGIAAWFAV